MNFRPMVRLPDDFSGPALWLLVRGREVFLADTGDGFGLPATGPGEALDLGGAVPILLGDSGGAACWAVPVDHAAVPPAEGLFVDLRRLWGMVSEHDWGLAGRAVQIVDWWDCHQYCGRCATPTEPADSERSRRCPACGLAAFPRLAPAVIVLVERGEEVLLANGANFGRPMYSTLAGFVEPGETLEEAVHREVFEEVGVSLRQPRYFASQPWPFPHSLMIGFHAEWESGDIAIDGAEIADAGWFRADSLPSIPGPMSIARRLIDDWLVRQSA
ncbi:MAG TPA: NAD(+) diphosphatase [Acidimicrobiales bacterium]|nr:NAD(+) diphosphatase [Acidimicrobiales bacterium]